MCQIYRENPTRANLYQDSTNFLLTNINCQEFGDDGSVPQPAPEPAPAPSGSNIPAGTCGKTAFPILPERKFNRIVGGVEATTHSIPWIVQIVSPGYMPHCGGTLIRVRPDREESDIVISAAHCSLEGAAKTLPRPFSVTAGAHYKESYRAEPGQVNVPVAVEAVHEYYSNPISYANDIVIYKLSTPIKFSSTIQPACLPSANEVPAVGVSGIVAGWGRTQEGGQSSSALQQVYLPIVGDDSCKTTYSTNFQGQYRVDPTIMMCSGFPAGGKDSCQGDSGVPYFFQGTKGYTLQGVVSWGDGCARAGVPGIYSRVTIYHGWIQQKIQQMSDVYKS